MPLLHHLPRTTVAGIGAMIGLAALAGCSGDSNAGPTQPDVTLELTIVSPVAVPIAIHVRETVTLTTKVTASDGSTPSGLLTAQWTSRNPAIASVTAAGLVRGQAVGASFIVAELSTTKGMVRDSIRVVVGPEDTPQ